MTPPIRKYATLTPRPNHHHHHHYHYHPLFSIPSLSLFRYYYFVPYFNHVSVNATTSSPSYTCAHGFHLLSVVLSTSHETTHALSTRQLKPVILILSTHGSCLLSELASHLFILICLGSLLAQSILSYRYTLWLDASQQIRITTRNIFAYSPSILFVPCRLY